MEKSFIIFVRAMSVEKVTCNAAHWKEKHFENIVYRTRILLSRIIYQQNNRTKVKVSYVIKLDLPCELYS
jgi:hypothetical protein